MKTIYLLLIRSFLLFALMKADIKATRNFKTSLYLVFAFQGSTTLKMKNFAQLLIFVAFISFSSSKVQILPEEGVEKCSENVENEAGYFSVDNLEVLVESDTDIFLNGSVKIMKELKSPWLSEYYAEQFYRDQWVRSPIQRKFDDLCQVFHSPTEMWYPILKDVPGCPFAEGVSNILLERIYSNPSLIADRMEI